MQSSITYILGRAEIQHIFHDQKNVVQLRQRRHKLLRQNYCLISLPDQSEIRFTLKGRCSSPIHIVAVHPSTLQQTRFHLRTISGISKQSYSHSIEFPVYGSGQGSGNLPGIWLFISSTLCDIHQLIAHGANNFQPQTELPFDTMMDNMQHDAQAWNDLLWCSGGKLELPKCSYQVLRFSFKPNGAHLLIPTKQLQIQDAKNGQLITNHSAIGNHLFIKTNQPNYKHWPPKPNIQHP